MLGPFCKEKWRSAVKALLTQHENHCRQQARISLFANKRSTADSKRECPKNKQEQYKMISDELKKIRGDSVVKGEDYPLKTCIMEWFIWGFCEGIDGMKGSQPKEGFFDSTAPSPFIVVCCNLWDSWFRPDHPLSSWIMVLFSGFSHEVFEVCWSLVFIPPNGYDAPEQQTSIPFLGNNPPASKPSPP
uniref:Uncharacterized protein n=1 Tax=Fagus sylvatica TaxID=28930 RepID=A0A2N9H1N3_FAGSY